MRATLSNITEVYECLQPHERKELVRLLLQRAVVSERRLTLEIRGGLQGLPAAAKEDKSGSRSQRPIWLPGAVARSVVVDRFRCTPTVQRHQGARSTSVATGARPDAADAWAGMLERGEVSNRAELARKVGVSRARVTQVLGTSAPRVAVDQSHQ